jgi:hypothetical protein
MRVRAHHLAASLLVGAVVLSSLAWLAYNAPAAQATCGTGSSVVVTSPSSTSTNSPLSGVRTLTAYSSPTTASGMTFMLAAPNQQPIGEAVQSGSTWKLDWDTRNVPNGPYELLAIAHFGTATALDCASPVVNFTIQNTPTQSPKLTATITPNTWQTPVNTTRTFSVDAIYTDQYGRQSHVGPTTSNSFMWGTSVGSLSTPSGPTTVLNAGTKIASGVLNANVNYSGLNATAAAQIKVTAPDGTSTTTSGDTKPPSPSPTPTASPTATAPGTGATTDDATRLATMPTIFRPADPTNSNPVVPLTALSCLEQKVGIARFNEISSGKSAPTTAERKSAADCFSGPTPIPAVLAPVPPSKITEVEQTTNLVKVANIKNTTVTGKDGKKITGLLVTGQGAPNSDVFIYVFSDPLVLRAQTDAKGAWSYVLETPLKPGKHEVYAVAEKDAGSFVRTSAVPISIAAASPGSQDGSLIIERTLSPAQIGFIALAALMVVASIIVTLVLLRRRRKAATAAAPADQIALPGSPATTPSPMPEPAAPAPTAAAPAPMPAATPAPGTTVAPTASASTEAVAEPPAVDGPKA